MKRSPGTLDLIEFLQTDLSLSASELQLVLRQHEMDASPLPMLLWQYGLVTLEQLVHIFDWLEDQVNLKLPPSFCSERTEDFHCFTCPETIVDFCF